MAMSAGIAAPLGPILLDSPAVKQLAATQLASPKPCVLPLYGFSIGQDGMVADFGPLEGAGSCEGPLEEAVSEELAELFANKRFPEHAGQLLTYGVAIKHVYARDPKGWAHWIKRQTVQEPSRTVYVLSGCEDIAAWEIQANAGGTVSDATALSDGWIKCNESGLDNLAWRLTAGGQTMPTALGRPYRFRVPAHVSIDRSLPSEVIAR
ncbi:hypothetical protein [Chitinimonas sp. JJ19]|uniref:hypothetical protein n=1 Tax=Chitinimonas sp. JJ19 TaxID=3109352 RepID=UPI003000F156